MSSDVGSGDRARDGRRRESHRLRIPVSESSALLSIAVCEAAFVFSSSPYVYNRCRRIPVCRLVANSVRRSFSDRSDSRT